MPWIRELVRLNSRSAVVGRIELSEPIVFISALKPIAQLHASTGRTHLLISAEREHSRVARQRLYEIELSTGEVTVSPWASIHRFVPAVS